MQLLINRAPQLIDRVNVARRITTAEKDCAIRGLIIACLVIFIIAEELMTDHDDINRADHLVLDAVHRNVK